MAESTSPPRPRQVTMAAVLGLVSSVLLVLDLFSAPQRIRSLETRRAIEEIFAQPPGNGLGVGYEDAVQVLQVLVFVNGALAAVAAVLAVYLFQRHQGARVGFSVAAALLLLSSPVMGGAMAILVAFAATLLWGRPARDWFAGRDPQPAPERSASQNPFRQPPPPHDSGPAEWQRPTPAPERGGPGERGEQPHRDSGDRPAPAAYPFGDPPPGQADHGGAVAPWQSPTPQGPAGTNAPAVVPRRPASVVVAAVITWASSALMLMMFLGVVLLLLAGRDFLVETLESDPTTMDQQVSMADLLAALWVVSAISIVWSLAAITLAVLAFRRQGWARIVLTVSAVVTALVGLGGAAAGQSPFPLVLTVAGTATAVLLFTGSANRWYAARGPVPGGPGPGAWGPPAPGQTRAPYPGPPSTGATPGSSPYPGPPSGSDPGQQVPGGDPGRQASGGDPGRQAPGSDPGQQAPGTEPGERPRKKRQVW